MATYSNNQVVETETNAEALGTETRATDVNATDTNAEAVETETRATDVNATDTNAEAAETETRATDVNATDTNAEAAETETRATEVNATEVNATDTNAEAVGTETRANTEPAESEIRPNLVWDNEAPGLCVRCYGDGAKSFIFVYRIGNRQRFIRIGETPLWSLEVARTRAKELRSIVDQGRDPARENCGRDMREIPPVENLIQYIAENLVPKP
jgi:hypothetical protein